MKTQIAVIAIRAPDPKALSAIEACESNKVACAEHEAIAVSRYTANGDSVYVLACRAEAQSSAATLKDVDDLAWRDDLETAQSLPQVWLVNRQMGKPLLGRFGDYSPLRGHVAPLRPTQKQWEVVRDFDIIPIRSGSLVFPERWRYGVLIAHRVEHAADLANAIRECLRSLGLSASNVELSSPFGDRHRLSHYQGCLPALA